MRVKSVSVALLILVCCRQPSHAADRPDVILLPASTGRNVGPEDMTRIYDEVKTPFKYGVVLRGGERELLDGPKVFRHAGRWWMIHVSFQDEIGYETHLARSDDLLHWERLGKILPFRGEGWDAWQGNGAPALIDHDWEGTHGIAQHEGKYWMSYVGGSRKGYETDPLAIGLATTRDVTAIAPWERFDGNPILSSAQRDARAFENVTLYTSTILKIDPTILGYPFVIFYNGKTREANHEAIGMAVSHDLKHWTRFGSEPVVDNAPGQPAISGNPQIVRIGNLWVMFYFGFRWKPGAFDTFACSHDLVHWTQWKGEDLVRPGASFDRKFAHKPWVLKHDGVVYHFYCAVGDEGRVIALATSRDLRTTPYPEQSEHTPES